MAAPADAVEFQGAAHTVSLGATAAGLQADASPAVVKYLVKKARSSPAPRWK